MHCQRRGVRNKGKMLTAFCCFTWRYFSKWRTTQLCLYLIPTFNDRNHSDWFVRALRRALTVTTWAPYLLRSNKNFYVHVFLFSLLFLFFLTAHWSWTGHYCAKLKHLPQFVYLPFLINLTSCCWGFCWG